LRLVSSPVGEELALLSVSNRYFQRYYSN